MDLQRTVRVTRSFDFDAAPDEIVPPPLDNDIPSDDELDALCDELMRFDAATMGAATARSAEVDAATASAGAGAPLPKTPIA